MVRPDRGTLTQGLRKAKMAYGQSASEDAQSAIAALPDRDRAIERSQQAPGMTNPRAVVVDRPRRLSASPDTGGMDKDLVDQVIQAS